MTKLEKVISYANLECPNCKRIRVEKYIFKGGFNLHICEKCNWCIEHKSYVHESEINRWLYD